MYQSPIGLVPVASTKAMQTMKTAKAMKAMKCAKAMKDMKAMKAMKAMKDADCPGMDADALAMKFAVAMKKAWDAHDKSPHWVPSARSRWHPYKAGYEPPHCPCCPPWVRMRAMEHDREHGENGWMRTVGTEFRSDGHGEELSYCNGDDATRATGP